MRFRSVLLVALLMLVSCGGGGAPRGEPSLEPSFVPGFEFLAATIKPDVPVAWDAASPVSLQAAADAYAAAWSHALPDIDFDPEVIVAALASGDTARSFCADKSLPFDVDSTTIAYCRVLPEGPDPFAQTGAILVPYRPYAVALAGQKDDSQVRLNSAMLLAVAYALHLRAEWQRGDLQFWDYCLAGLSLRAFVPSTVSDDQWAEAMRFGLRFHIIGVSGATPGSRLHQMKLGYDSGRLRSCIG